MSRLIHLWLPAAAGFAASLAVAQNPQSTLAPIVSVNSAYNNGISPGYAPTLGTGLTISIGPGTANCSGTIVTYTGGTPALTASTINYVYLNTGSSCAVAVKTSTYGSSDIPIAMVTTNGSGIVQTCNNKGTSSPSGVYPCIVDDRTIFNVPGSGGSAITALTGDGTATGPGSSSFILATVNSGPGTCGDGTHVCQVTTNGKGLVTGQSAVLITGGGSGVNPATGKEFAWYNGTGTVTNVSGDPNFVDNGSYLFGLEPFQGPAFISNGSDNGALNLGYTGTPAVSPGTGYFQMSPAVPITTPWAWSPAPAPGTGIVYGTNSAGVFQQTFIANGGATGDVLTQQASGPPLFEPAGGGAMVNIGTAVSWSGCTFGATQCVAAGASTTVSISSIPGTYNELRIVFDGQTNAGSDEPLNCEFNGDTASNYSWAYLIGYPSTAAGSGSSSQGSMQEGIVASSSGTSQSSQYILDSINYAGTTFYKSLSSAPGAYNNSGGSAVNLYSGRWKNTVAVTSISCTLASGDFVSGSTFTVYGVL